MKVQDIRLQILTALNQLCMSLLCSCWATDQSSTPILTLLVTLRLSMINNGGFQAEDFLDFLEYESFKRLFYKCIASLIKCCSLPMET